MTLKDVTKKVQESNNERQKTDKELFIEEMTPYANDAAAELGIDPKILIAQAGHETGWGKHVAKNADGTTSHNLFNIKTTKGWKGDSTRITTHEIEGGKSVKQKASFRSYSSYKESFQDYTKFIQENKRYAKAVEAGKKGDSVGYVKEMAKAGYATDTSYSEKVLKTAASIGTGALVGVGVAKTSKTIATAISKGVTKGISSTSSVIGKVADTVNGVFQKTTDTEEETTEVKQTSITVVKPKKKIGYETQGLTGWHKRVIEMLTDWANSKRSINQENKSDTISINQALNEKDETEVVQLPQEKSSIVKPIAKTVIGATTMLSIPAIANVAMVQIKKTELSNITPKKETEKEIKINPSQLPKIESKKIETTDSKKTVQEKFTGAVNSVVNQINKPIIKNDTTPIKAVLNKPTFQKVIPKQTEKEQTQRTIIISDIENKEIMNDSKVFLFGDRYSAKDDIKQISLLSRDFGTGLTIKH